MLLRVHANFKRYLKEHLVARRISPHDSLTYGYALSKVEPLKTQIILCAIETKLCANLYETVCLVNLKPSPEATSPFGLER